MKYGKIDGTVCSFFFFVPFSKTFAKSDTFLIIFLYTSRGVRRRISHAPDLGSTSDLPLTLKFLLSFVKIFLRTVFGQLGSETLDTDSNPTVFMHNS